MPVYGTLDGADITCLDYSADMMEWAKRQAEKRGLKNVRFLQGDVGKQPFEDGSFDLVLSLNGFHAFPDKEAAYSEIFRVLKPGGIEKTEQLAADVKQYQTDKAEWETGSIGNMKTVNPAELARVAEPEFQYGAEAFEAHERENAKKPSDALAKEASKPTVAKSR